MNYARLYVVLSFSAFAYAVAQSWLDYRNTFEVSMILTSTRAYLALTYNFLVAVGVSICDLIVCYFCGPPQQSDLRRIWEDLINVIQCIAFSFLSAFFDSKLPIPVLAWIPLPFFLWYLAFAFKQTVTSFSLHKSSPTVEQHLRLITGQITLCTISLYFALLFWRWSRSGETESRFLILALHGLHAFFDHTLGISLHILYIFDHWNLGNSLSTSNAYYVTSLIVGFAHFVLDVVIFIKQLKGTVHVNQLPPFIVLRITQILADFHALAQLRRAREILRKSFQRPTPVELAEHELCILCRTSMSVEQASKLPCGHFLHTDCLERWLAEKGVCPICQVDLSRPVVAVGAGRLPRAEPRVNLNWGTGAEAQQVVMRRTLAELGEIRVKILETVRLLQDKIKDTDDEAGDIETKQ
jgi:hypothetical protein